MDSLPWRPVLAGSIFGAALTAAGVYQPSVIITQMQLTNFHMLKAFLIASGLSTFILKFFNSSANSPCDPRTSSSLGLFGHYDGNIIGGATLGCGLALAGACPGTVLPQVATRVPTGIPVLSGCVLGGVLHSALFTSIRQQTDTVLLSNEAKERKSKQSSSPKTKNSEVEVKITELDNELYARTEAVSCQATERQTIYEQLSICRDTAVGSYFVLCASAFSLLGILTAQTYPSSTLDAPILSLFLPASFTPLVGGQLIAIAQATSLHLTFTPLGISSAYGQIGDLILWCLSELTDSTTSRLYRPLPENFRNIYFALGGLLGPFIVSLALPNQVLGTGGIDLRATGEPLVDIGMARAVVGGVLLVLGSRIAGGCTSGHGISGMASLSTASFISVAAMFGSGILIGLLLK